MRYFSKSALPSAIVAYTFVDRTSDGFGFLPRMSSSVSIAADFTPASDPTRSGCAPVYVAVPFAAAVASVVRVTVAAACWSTGAATTSPATRS